MAALRDRPAQQDRVAEALWLAQSGPKPARTSPLAAGPAATRLGGARPHGLRGALVVALVAAVVVAGPQIPGRLGRAFTLDFAFAHFGGPPPTVTAWVTPPAYTGRAPFLLSPQTLSFAAPAGSRLTVTVAGTGKAACAAARWGDGRQLPRPRHRRLSGGDGADGEWPAASARQWRSTGAMAARSQFQTARPALLSRLRQRRIPTMPPPCAWLGAPWMITA